MRVGEKERARMEQVGSVPFAAGCGLQHVSGGEVTLHPRMLGRSLRTVYDRLPDHYVPVDAGGRH